MHLSWPKTWRCGYLFQYKLYQRFNFEIVFFCLNLFKYQLWILSQVLPIYKKIPHFYCILNDKTHTLWWNCVTVYEFLEKLGTKVDLGCFISARLVELKKKHVHIKKMFEKPNIIPLIKAPFWAHFWEAYFFTGGRGLFLC